MDNEFLNKVSELSAERVKAFFEENQEEILGDIHRITKEAEAQETAAVVRISHSITLNLDKSVHRDTFTWNVSKKVIMEGATPSGDKEEADNSAPIWAAIDPNDDDEGGDK